MARPRIFVLAGVNGAGKSTIGGAALQRIGLDWFNPDTFARQLVEGSGHPLAAANATAWQEGMRRLEAAINSGNHHAFETTLGGNTITRTLRAAATTHDIAMWFCGLDSPERHIARVRQRVSRGGHDIPEAKIRERWVASISNLIALLPAITRLQLYDNSVEAVVGEPSPDPRMLLQMEAGRIIWPVDANALAETPDWAKPILEAALRLHAASAVR